MARIRRTEKSPCFTSLIEERHALGETNDCAIYCLSIVMDVPYAEVLTVSYLYGRDRRKGTPWDIIHSVANHFGFRLTRVSYLNYMAIIRSYPERDQVLQNITTHHPRRFAKQWANKPTMIFDCNRHVAAFKDGRIHDWAEGRALRVWRLWLVEKV